MSPFMNAATSIAMAQSRQSTDSLKSSNFTTADDKQKSSSAEASNDKGRFTKTSEDRNGMLRFTNGQIIIGKRRRLLLVGTGIRHGEETAKEQAVFAVHDTSDSDMKSCQYYWGPAGQETKAKYTDVKRWMLGFWKEQISNSMFTDEESRMGRIWNIFHDEQLDQVMATRFDPTTLVGYRKIDVEALPNRKRKTADTSDDENDEPKKSKTLSNSQTHWPNPRMAEAANLASDNKLVLEQSNVSLPISSNNKPVLEQSEVSLPNSSNNKPILKQSAVSLPIGSKFDKTEEDLDVDLDLMQGRPCGDTERVGLLHVGMGTRRTGGDITGSQAIFVRMLSGNTSYGTVNYYWGPAGKETKAKYSDVEHWFRGFWKQQIVGHDMTNEEARAVRVRALYRGVETIQDAMTTQLSPSTVELMQNMKRRTEQSVLDAQGTLNHNMFEESVQSAESVHTSDQPKTLRMLKSAEDYDGDLEMAQGRPIGSNWERVNILKVGLGIREGHEDKGEQAIYARPIAGSRLARYYWGPPGREAKAQYGDVQQWCRGFWKDQVNGYGMSDEAARSLRIRNVCQGQESLATALVTPIDPQTVRPGPKPSPRPASLRPPVLHRSTRGRFVTKDVEYDHWNSMADNTDDDDDGEVYPPMPDLLPAPSSKLTPTSALPSQNRSTDQVNSFPFARTSGDIDRKPWLAKGKVIDGHTKQMLAVGTTKDSVVIFGEVMDYLPEAGSPKRRISYHLGCNGPRAKYDDVAYWFRGFWWNQCAPNVTARVFQSRQRARSARAIRLFEGLETIEQAIRTTIVGTVPRNKAGAGSEDEPEGSGVETEEEDECLVKVTKKLSTRSTLASSTKRNLTQASIQSLQTADIDKIPYFTTGRVMRAGQLRRMMAVGESEDGRVVFVDLETPSTLPSGKLEASTPRYHIGPAGSEETAGHDDVFHWYRGFWAVQVSVMPQIYRFSTPRTLRALRARRILTGEEGIDHAIKTRMVIKSTLDGSGREIETEELELASKSKADALHIDRDHVTARKTVPLSAPVQAVSTLPNDRASIFESSPVHNQSRATSMDSISSNKQNIPQPSGIAIASISDQVAKNPSKIIRFPYVATQAAMVPAATPTPTLSVLTGPATTLPTSSTSTSADAVTTSFTPTPAAVDSVTITMTSDEAYAIFSDEQNIKRSPQEIQTAISVLAGSTPPLKLIQQACFACRVGKIQSIYDFEGLRKFLQECDMM